ncbi:DUF934 domain-containing protein [Algiphilus sp.]|uniref:DUF934 domain-containing protein n=1 Tax=Algiphilus sp. TaxID=1872431 RepID=UPI0025C11ADC|nr:DUF934 domain-containing protein [Algiphilus sp.]MCK5769244.1 DUF934 domain-containing protein [Algiphilus sp.]
MAAIIRDRAVVEDDRRLLGEDDALPGDDTPVIVTWERWQTLLDGTAEDDGRHPAAGVLIPNTLDLAEGWPLLQHRTVIALDFPAFPDGRAYSQARLLRDRYGFQGEIRATGQAVVRDQLHELDRCGVNAFALRDDQDPQGCLKAFETFSDAYQPACDGVEPIWKRRREAAAG